MMLYTISHPGTRAIRVRVNSSQFQLNYLFGRSCSIIRTLSTTQTHDTTTNNVKVTPLKQWKVPMIESHGDYRAEAFLEGYIGGPLYEHQSTLPRLPVPSIEDTLKRFLPTALPLAKNDQERAALIQATKDFPEQAHELQKRLLDRKEEMGDSSWLQLWWNTLGYLQVRDPVVVNVSYFFHFVDDPTISTSSEASVQRGATLLYAAAEFRKLVCSGQLPQEQVGRGKVPLCSTAYKYQFHATRIPQREQDSYRIYDPSRYTHCVVARKGHFFSVELVDPESGDPLPVSVLEAQLKRCIELADEIPDTRSKLGILTSQNRDDWADARSSLIELGGSSMEDALEKLESGAFLLSLDDEAPVSRQECCDILLHGGPTSGSNRWFDKSIQLIVTNNGKAGVLGEHAMMDGMPLVNFASHVTSTTYKQAKEESSEDPLAGGQGKVRDIFQAALDEADEKGLQSLEIKATEDFLQLIGAQSNHVQSFQGYGSTFMKESGFSPDAYVQVAMQLATYRLFGEQVGTYEATQVRAFHHGRTETTRSVSTDSEAFIKKMSLRPKRDETDEVIRKEKLRLLRNATKAHSEYTKIAAQAQGVDRHFLGLGMLVRDGESAPSLLGDPVFVRSKRWRLSTSHLTHPNFKNWGFGQVFPDGVGVGYAILPRSCVFNITALRETGWTDKLSELLEEALLEMQQVLELENASRSKL